MTQSNTKTLLMNLQWLYSIGAKVVAVAPLQTIAITLLTLVSQVSLLLAFLLPIKVIILLGSDKVPRYFPESLTLIDRDLLIVGLTATSICCYLLHILCDRSNVRIGAMGTEKILARTRKLELFENQTGRARRAFVEYSSGLAAIVFLAAGFAALVAIYPLVAIVISIGWVLSFAVGMVRYAADKSFRENIFQRLPEFAKTCADVIFLSVFLSIVSDFLQGDPPGILIGLISMILVRQWIQRGSTLIANLSGLVSRRVEVSALFFHAQTAALANANKQPLLWQLVQQQRQSGFSEILAAVDMDSDQPVKSQWLQTGSPGIACFTLHLADAEAPRDLLIKLFAKQRQTYVTNEFTVLTMPNPEKLPAPQLIGVTSIEGISCHIFAMPHMHSIPLADRLQAIARYRCLVSGIMLEADFLNRYQRSHPGLWLRIDHTKLDRLAMIANDKAQVELIEATRSGLGELQAFLKAMPAALVHAEATRANLFLDAEDSPYCIHWGRWSVDPIGSSWPVNGDELGLLDQYHAELQANRKDMKSVPVEHLKLAALAWEFDRLFQRELYADSLAMLQQLADHFDALTPHTRLQANQGR